MEKSAACRSGADATAKAFLDQQRDVICIKGTIGTATPVLSGADERKRARTRVLSRRGGRQISFLAKERIARTAHIDRWRIPARNTATRRSGTPRRSRPHRTVPYVSASMYVRVCMRVVR